MRWTIWSKRVSNSVMCRFLFYVRRLSFINLVAGAMVGGAFFHKTLKALIDRQKLWRLAARLGGFQILWAKMLSINIAFEPHALASLRARDGQVIDASP